MMLADHINLMGANPLVGEPWPGLPRFGLLEGYNEARDQEGTLMYSFVNRVLIARRPV